MKPNLDVLEWNTPRAREHLLLRLGGAVFFSQLVERVIYASLLCLKYPTLTQSVEDFFSEDAEKRGPTLGKLMTALKTVAKLEPNLERRVTEFVKLRNRVIHRLFTEDPEPRTEAIESFQGKLTAIETLIAECQHFMKLFLGFLAHFPRPSATDDAFGKQIQQLYDFADDSQAEGKLILGGILRKTSRS